VGPFELKERFNYQPEWSLWHAVRSDGAEPREVAIRVAERVTDADTVAAIRGEYDLLKALDDRRIRKTVGYVPAIGAVVLEWVPGVTVDRLMILDADRRLLLDAATAIDIITEVATALRYAHGVLRSEGPVLHSSLSPRSIRLGIDGRVVVFDWGAPIAYDGPVPDEALDGEWTAASDQWLLGALAVELITGRPLAMADRDSGQVKEVAIQFALETAGWRCPPMVPVLKRMLAPDPFQRWLPESALVRALVDAGGQVGSTSRRAEVAKEAWEVEQRVVREPVISRVASAELRVERRPLDIEQPPPGQPARGEPRTPRGPGPSPRPRPAQPRVAAPTQPLAPPVAPARPPSAIDTAPWLRRAEPPPSAVVMAPFTRRASPGPTVPPKAEPARPPRAPPRGRNAPELEDEPGDEEEDVEIVRRPIGALEIGAISFLVFMIVLGVAILFVGLP
jgi:hypothetical protein